MSARSAVCPVHVGRDVEVRILHEVMESVRAQGRGRLLLVAGQAGVGKSRLVAEANRLATRAGLSRLEGQCAPEATVPYACFVTAVRRRTRTLDTDQLAALFGGQAAMSAALLPEVAQAVGRPAATPSAEDLFAAVWQLLGRLARPSGGLLVLEDLHWADPDSLRLLTYLARELDDLPLWIVGTYRSDELHRRHPLTAVLAELSRERRYDEVVLAPLDREKVRSMLSAIFDGTEVGDEFSDVVLDRTGGNPFFVEELAKVLVERGDVFHEGGDWERRDLADIELPISVRETLLARARSMDPTSVNVLQLAAVAADHLDLAVLAEAASVSPEQVDDAVREGLRLQILVERRDGVGTGYAFRHALSREAFAEELVGPDRRHAHRRLAEAIVRIHAADVDAVAPSLADHFAAAGDDPAAFGYALRAARSAAASFAFDEADRRYDQALRLLPGADERRVELLLEAAGSVDSFEVGRMKVAFAEEARRLASARGDPVAQARALYPLEHERWLAGDGAGAIALLGQARSLVHGKDDFQEAWVLRRLSRVLMLGDRLDEVDVLLEEGIELALRSANLAALSGLYGTRMMMEPYGPAFRAAYTAAAQAARSGQDVRAELNLNTNAGYTALWCGDFARSRESFRQGIQIGERISPTDRYVHAGYSWLLSLTGEYDAALGLARPLMADRAVPTRVVALTALVEIAQRQGSPEAAALVEELWEVAHGIGEAQRSVPALSARARQVLADDGVDAALGLFWTLLGMTLNSRMQGSHWSFSPDLARALSDEGRGTELTRWVAEVVDTTEADPNAHNVAARSLCQAYLLSAQGHLFEARDAFEDATARYRALPCPAREVEAKLGLAELGSRAGGPDAASDLVRAALDTAHRIGAGALVERALRAQERIRSRPVLATVLFTDIVGSTERAAALGDRGWRELLERHHAIVRRELARTRGREVDTAGDGFLAAFDTPAQAIRCACAIRDALDAAGIPIRAGLHTGECQESGGKLTGLTVHIAARVSQSAGAGEVLVSSTVKDLVAGSGLAFADRGVHPLKGIPGEWRLFASALPVG